MASNAPIDLTVLECASCGAAIPLGDADALACGSCGATAELPEAHRALRVTDREHARALDEAHRLLRKLARPPSRLTRFLANANGGTVVWLVSFGTVLSGLVFPAALSLIGRLSLAVLRVHLDDVLLYRYDPTALLVIGHLAFLLAALGALVCLGAYARQRGRSLRELQAGLSARPPERAGGVSTCRACGAPLTVNPGDTAVTCTYCRADNLVNIPESWIGEVRTRTRRLANAAGEAAREFEDEKRAIRRSLLVRLAVVTALSVGMLTFLVGVTDAGRIDSSTNTPYRRSIGGLFDWKKQVARPGLILDEMDAKGCRGVSCVPALSERPCAERRNSRPLVVPAGACDSEACTLHWYVALRRGDALEITANGLPPRTFVLLESHAFGAPFDRNPAAWGEHLPGRFAWLVDGEPSRLKEAPHDGWFQLTLGLGAAIPDAPLGFCARLERLGR